MKRSMLMLTVLCFLCGSTPRSAEADLNAVWTGIGANDDVFNEDNWSWLGNPPSYGLPDDDTTVILDHTAVHTTLGFYEHYPNNRLYSDTVTVGNGTDPVTYHFVSYAGVAHWPLSCSDAFTVRSQAAVNFKNIRVYDMRLMPGSTLLVEEDGHLITSGLSVGGNLQLVLPDEPSGECVIAEYGHLTGQFASAAGLPPGWRIEYGSGTLDYIRAVPEPSAWILLIAGTLSVAGYGWRRWKRA